ncbi:hypothetical protein D3C71_1296400 [compost metagenome]
MVLGHDDVEFTAAGAHEDGVAGPGAAGVDAFGASGGNGRFDDVDVFAAELAAFARVRIQARDRHARLRDAHLPAGAVRQPHGGELGLGRDAGDDVRQGHVDGYQQHAQFVVGQHHREVLRGGSFGQDLGVARVVDPGLMHGFLVKRGSHDGADAAGLRIVDRCTDVVVGAAPCAGADLPGGQVGRQGRAASDDIDVARIRAGLTDAGNFDHFQACPQLGRGAAQCARVAIHHARGIQALRVSLDDDLGTDAGGIAHGDSHGQGRVHDGMAPHSKVTVARLDPRPVAWLDVIFGFCSLRPMDWQY